MIRFMLAGTVAMGVVLAATADKAMAQALANNGLTHPAVSPYLNLNQGGNQGINYYALVKPQINTAKQLQTLQTQIQQQQLMPQLGAAAVEDDGLMANYAVTGHPSGFFNLSHYYGQAGTLGRPVPPPTAVLKK
jgi:hypothetical protein